MKARCNLLLPEWPLTPCAAVDSLSLARKQGSSTAKLVACPIMVPLMIQHDTVWLSQALKEVARAVEAALAAQRKQDKVNAQFTHGFNQVSTLTA